MGEGNIHIVDSTDLWIYYDKNQRVTAFSYRSVQGVPISNLQEGTIISIVWVSKALDRGIDGWAFNLEEILNL